MISEQELLSRLDGVQKNSTGWQARCPAHGDKNPSLSITRADDGKWLLHCHAGCSVPDIVKAIGVELKDLMPESNKNFMPTKHGKFGTWQCDYVYTDEVGKVLYKSCRYLKDDGKKTFVIKVPDDKSKYGWSYGLTKNNVMRVPYHLPKVIEAAKRKQTIFIVEGEKDVESVERLGFTATCNVAGAMKWGVKFPNDWIKWFNGSNIVIISDNDPQYKTVEKHVKGEVIEQQVEHWKGQRHAMDVRRQFMEAGFTGRIKLMVMPQVDGQQRVKDFTDWVEARTAAGLTADATDLANVIKTAEPWPNEWYFDNETPAPKIETSAPATNTIGDNKRFGAVIDGYDGVERYGLRFDMGGGKFVSVSIDYGWTVEQIFSHMLVTISKACPNNEIPKGVPVRVKAWSAALWLLTRGSFFWHSDHEHDYAHALFLDRDERDCRLMRIMSNEFYAFIGKAAGLEQIDPKKGDMAKILGLVQQIAVDSEYAEGVLPGNSWERRGDAVYISSGDTQMCRIKDGKVEFVQNGTDGVVFLRGNTLMPWELVDQSEALDPFEASPIFKDASWVEEFGCMNIRLWTMNLFAQHKTKPMLLITGKAQSGKTRMARAIKEILGVRKRGIQDSAPLDVEDNDKGREAFWVAVNNGKVEIFDNLDTKIKWVSNTFQNAATGGSTKRRQLYSDDGEAIYEANAAIIITSNNPLFSTEGDGGMADRIITINLASRTWSAEDTIDQDIERNRNRYLTWMAYVLAKVLQDKAAVDTSVNRRHPAYGAFSIKVGRAIGREEEVIKALGAAEVNKAILPLMNDPVTKEILLVLSDNNWQWSGTAGDMSAKIIARQGDDADDKTQIIYSSRRIGKALNKYIRQFAMIFKMDEPRISEGRTKYSFLGTTLLGAQAVGLVDLNGGFGKVQSNFSLYALSQNMDFNPPNPPYPPSGVSFNSNTLKREENLNSTESIDLDELMGED